MSLPRTPSQTVGPYLRLGLDWPDGPLVVPLDTPGAIWIRGRLLDGDGAPVDDGLIETWQADAEGRFVGAPEDPSLAPDAQGRTAAGFRGFGRCATGPDGSFAILTLRPGSVAAPDGRPQAPHVDVSVFARGLLTRLVTRIYFEDEESANSADPVLAAIPDADVRSTLVARRSNDGYAFDICLQGPRETAFFDV